MNKTTANDIQVQEVVQKYIGTIKAKTVAEKVYEVMREETQHTHNGRECFIHQDETGALVLTMESMVKKSVETILRQYLEDDNVEKCLVQLMPENTATEKIMGIEVIHVKGSNSEIYTKLLKHKASDECEERFMIELQTAIEAGVKSFYVPVCDPSIDANGELQFVPGCKAAVDYSYNKWKGLAKEKGIRLGTKNEYFLFVGTILNRLIAEGWSESEAFKAVCTDSTELVHYLNSASAKNDFELTGSRQIGGKCYFSNSYKILAKDERSNRIWIAGGRYFNWGEFRYSLTHIIFEPGFYDDVCFDGFVGWFVL